jgi:hypothetical protein
MKRWRRRRCVRLEETGITAQVGQLSDWGVENVYEIYPVRHRYAPGA